LSEAVFEQSGLSSLSEAVFFDTELIVTKVWFIYAFGRYPEWLEEAIKAYPMDAYLLTYPDTPWVPDPARYNGSDAIRKELFERYETEIQATDVPYYIIKHDLKI
jgi:nicotinamide riboside kinase